MGTHTGPILEGRGDSDYERYVRVPELLELQKPAEELSHPEERLFQTTHQAAELWLHHVDYEIGRAVALIADDDIALAAELLDRCARIINLLRQQIVVGAHPRVHTGLAGLRAALAPRGDADQLATGRDRAPRGR